MITVFADKYLYHIKKLLPDKKVDLHLYDPANGIPENLEKAEGLLIRTVNRIDEDLINRLPDSIRFIATGSAGTDHVDVDLLEERNIAFADAAGCNARSVAEYVATALLLWSEDLGQELKNKSIGIVGMGHVGTEVDQLLQALGMSTIGYDPPRAEREQTFISAELDEVLSADILTFHTPLTKDGDYPTFHWMDEQKLASHDYELLINTARGGVVDEQALLRSYINGKVQNFVIDVWENEPLFHDLVASNAYIRTPHIAGYSKEAKFKASQLIVEALCNFFSIEKALVSHQESSETVSLPSAPAQTVSLSEVLCRLHPIKDYQKELYSLIGVLPDNKEKAFNKVRAEHPLRNEFSSITLPVPMLERWPLLQKIGLNSQDSK